MKLLKSSSKTLLRPPSDPTIPKCEAYVYAVSKGNNVTRDFNQFLKDWRNPFPQCYVGLTNDMIRRWAENGQRMSRPDGPLTRYIVEHKLERDKHMRVLFGGSEKLCSKIEFNLRYQSHMGLNTKIGARREVDRVYFSDVRTLQEMFREFVHEQKELITC